MAPVTAAPAAPATRDDVAPVTSKYKHHKAKVGGGFVGFAGCMHFNGCIVSTKTNPAMAQGSEKTAPSTVRRSEIATSLADAKKIINRDMHRFASAKKDEQIFLIGEIADNLKNVDDAGFQKDLRGKLIKLLDPVMKKYLAQFDKQSKPNPRKDEAQNNLALTESLKTINQDVQAYAAAMGRITPNNYSFPNAMATTLFHKVAQLMEKDYPRFTTTGSNGKTFFNDCSDVILAIDGGVTKETPGATKNTPASLAGTQTGGAAIDQSSLASSR